MYIYDNEYFFDSNINRICFLIDDESDLAYLPTVTSYGDLERAGGNNVIIEPVDAGSLAHSIETSKKYILNSLNQWVEFKSPGGGGGGGNANVREISKEDYDALSEAEKMNGTIYFVYDEEGGGGGGSADLTADLTASMTVGGVPVGKTYTEGTPLETIIRNMLSPTLYPTLTDPSATISSSVSTLIEEGGSAEATLTVNFNRGSISPAYGTSGYRSGEAINYSLNGSAAQTSKTFVVSVNESHKSFVATVSYAAGEQPKDSNGNNYSSPLPAGSLTSGALNFEFVNAIWANTSDSSDIGKLPLVSKDDKQAVLNFPACTELDPETFDVPSDWVITAIEIKNEISGAWDDCTETFTASSVTHQNAAGQDVAYTRYVCNLGYDMGARPVRLKWS